MASINGISIKKLVSYESVEGPCAHAVLYLDNKMIGFWSQDNMGGADHFSFESKELRSAFEKRVEDYYKTHPQVNCAVTLKMSEEEFKEKKNSLPVAEFGGEGSYLLCPDCFMGNLATLTYLEKEYKKFAKKGLPYMVDVTHHYVSFKCPVNEFCFATDNMELVNKKMEELEAKDVAVRFDVFTSLDSFVK